MRARNWPRFSRKPAWSEAGHDDERQGIGRARQDRGATAMAGTRARVGFKSDATLDQITAFLVAYHASFVSGPLAGRFTVKFGDTTLAAKDAEQLIAKVKADKIVTFAAATQ